MEDGFESLNFTAALVQFRYNLKLSNNFKLLKLSKIAYFIKIGKLRTD